MERIAIIGMAGRFPGAKTTAQFWENLRNGTESISFFSDEELRAAGVSQDMLNASTYVRARGVLDDVELFDAGFFGINPKEAEITDPQHRLFLECAWEALEHAGYDSEKYDDLIGVFAASSVSRYGMSLFALPHLLESVGVSHILISNGVDHLPTQVSYRLNLKGPSIAVQTSCSSSLVAIQLACQSLLNYQCDIALAGGVTIVVPQKSGYPYQEGSTHSPDGHCRAFDAKAQGLVEGNAVGIVVLKRLSEALADGDYIDALIRGAAVNNDGSRKVGYTAPSIQGQVEVINAALSMAEVDAESISYVEAHGTGTVLGDPVEVAALTQAFRATTEKRNFCALGTVKSNIGHTDAAAGVAGVIKTTLALGHGELPPSLHYEEANPQINFGESPFYVNRELRVWERGRTRRRAGVSSFGIGGTNAHVVLEEAPEREVSGESSREWHLLPLSAMTATALETATSNLAAHLEQNPTLRLADVAYTLQVGRRDFSHRRIVICRGVADAVQALHQPSDSPHVETQMTTQQERPVVFMFPGQGTQYVNAGRDLYETEPLFREVIDHCAEALLPHTGSYLRTLLYPEPEHRKEAETELNKTYVTQPVLFVIEYALAKLLMSWGVQPAAMIGHSIGEYVAACLAGVFTLEDALKLVATRGRLMQDLPSGAMLAVKLSEEEAHTRLRDGLSLAAVNGSMRCVIAGATNAIANLEKQLSDEGIPCQRLNTSHAFHSEMVNAVRQEFVAAFDRVPLRAPEIPYISNLTGAWISDAEATDPENWARHMRETVRFADGVRELLKNPDRILLEVGPGQTLSTLVRQHPDKSSEQPVLSTLRSTFESQSEWAFLLTNLGKLWLQGTPISWSHFHASEHRKRLPLPTYPFERQRYWIEPAKPADYAGAQRERLHKKPDISDWFHYHSWKRSIAPRLLAESHHARHAGNWMVLIDESGIGSRVVEKLKLAGRQVTTVTMGERFVEIDEHSYQINPRRQEDYDLLLEELIKTEQEPQVILHFWTINAPTEDESFARIQEQGFYSLLFMTKAFVKKNFTSSLQVEVVSSGLQKVEEREEPCPAKATLLGPCKVIPQEYANVTFRNIDITPANTAEEEEERTVKQLLAEFETEPTDTVVAYRGQSRWVQTFEALRIEGLAERPPALKEQGVYFLIGGLGHIGSIVAEYLAKTVSARLVLFGSTKLPPREDWEHWLAAHSDDDKISRKLRRAQKVEAAGAEVLIVSGDIAREEDVITAIKQSIEKFGSLDGVIHAAGVSGGKGFREIQELSVSDCELHFQAKVYGLKVLEKSLRGLKLDFCLLFSSLSTVLGGLGFCAYSAANLFADAFAQSLQGKSSTPWLTVDWDGWQTEDIRMEGARTGLSDLAITPAEGIEAVRRILSSMAPHLIVSTGDLKTRLTKWGQHGILKDLPQVNDKPAAVAHLRPPLQNAFVPPRNELERAVAILWKEVLGIEDIGVDDDFFELKGDSLLATQLIARVRNVFQVDVPLHAFFETPSIAALANAIDAHDIVPGKAQRIAKALNSIKGMSEAAVLKSLERSV